MRTVIVYNDAYQRVVKRFEQHAIGRPSDEWDAIFSCNPDRIVWPSYHLGYSDPDDRIYVRAPTKLLCELVDIVLADRDLGGRFFINKEGVFVKPEYEQQRQIVSFDWRVGRFG